MTLEAATGVFVRAFTEGKNLTCPYVLDRIDGLWVMHDPPGKRYPRKTEVVATRLTPKDTVQRVQKAKVGWHFLCHIHGLDEDFDEIRRQYKALGYRAISTEWLFVHRLASVPACESDPPVRRVNGLEQCKSIPQRSSQKRKFRPPRRLYGVWDEVADYGWVESVPVGKDAWVSGLHVYEDQRGRGYGRALMSRLLLDDKNLGVKTSVLLASSDGARLYPHLGYEKIGILQMFCPKTRNQ